MIKANASKRGLIMRLLFAGIWLLLSLPLLAPLIVGALITRTIQLASLLMQRRRGGRRTPP